jgi:hypothetical protein
LPLSPSGYPACRPKKPTSPPRSLTPASGRQDHTTSPSASARFVKRTVCVHRILPPTFVTIAKRPFWKEQDGASCRDVLPDAAIDLFFTRDLDEPNQFEFVQENRAWVPGPHGCHQSPEITNKYALTPPGAIYGGFETSSSFGKSFCLKRLSGQRLFLCVFWRFFSAFAHLPLQIAPWRPHCGRPAHA